MCDMPIASKTGQTFITYSHLVTYVIIQGSGAIIHFIFAWKVHMKKSKK